MRNTDQPGAAPSSFTAAAPSEESAEALLLAVGRRQDRAAFASLFAQFAPRLKAYLRRLGSDAGAAEELAQEVMLLVWRRAETFDPAQASAATWIFTIARNKRIDALRREQRPEIDLDDPALVPDPVEDAESALSAAQASGRLRDALGGLPPEQAVLLRMAYFEDKPHSTIATETGIPLGTVKSRLRLAMDRLRKSLRDAG
ncbi:sigma-70 family RNA polymerase sigma factor [Azospirillum sp. SYSU D00513]|uniref:sigma-70 family RNA polymerase sigma factor n=1 Tax=Azospirillum sp. SYSU D00513 TaxID=2812561 RepID=UPI001A95DD94|nr:sigma-70 family RNA polymerase sigma factor [Azospirillum sp. SYSU D00513]